MNPATLQARGWQGLCATLLWVGLMAVFSIIPLPTWADPLFPLPSLLLVADALGPRPLFVRWRVGVGPGAARLISALVVGLAVSVAWLALADPTPTTDQPPTIVCAARDLWHGVDPYNTYEPQCLARLRPRTYSATPLEQGPFRQNTKYPSQAQISSALKRDQARGSHAGFPAYGYPPDTPLLILPVAFAGWPGISIWVAVLSALLLAAIWGRGLAGAAPVFAWQLAGLALLWASFRWNPEDLSYLLLALSLARIDRARLSSVLLAAAISTNPLAWPITPVYLAILIRRPERRARWVWLLAALALGTLPWLIWDHRLPQHLWGFLTLAEFPIGASLGVLAKLPSHSHLIYSAGMLAGIAGCTLVAWRWPSWRWTMAALVYGAFLLSWRGPLYYFMPALWLGPAIVLGACRIVAGGVSPESAPPPLPQAAAAPG